MNNRHFFILKVIFLRHTGMLPRSVYVTERPAMSVFSHKEVRRNRNAVLLDLLRMQAPPAHELDAIAGDMFSLIQELRRMSQEIGHRPISRSRTDFFPDPLC